MQTQSNEAQDFTVKQAGLQLAATPTIVRKAIKDGLLKSYKISERNTRITQKALDEFKNNGGAIV
jgi:hypothetical protein